MQLLYHIYDPILPAMHISLGVLKFPVFSVRCWLYLLVPKTLIQCIGARVVQQVHTYVKMFIACF